MLLLYTSSQIGGTYGNFRNTLEENSSIELCSVFPGQIEQLLNEFDRHVDTLIELKSKLTGYSGKSGYSPSADISAMTLPELDQAAQELSGQMASAAADIEQLDQQLKLNAGVWGQMLQEAASTAAVLQKIGGYMLNSDPNCLEIRDAQFFEKFRSHVDQSNVISETLAETLAGIIKYLSSIHELDSAAPEGSGGILFAAVAPDFPAEEPILSFMARTADPADSGISSSLQSVYDGLSADMNASKDALNSAVSGMQAQQQQIADAKAKLEAEAKAKAEEEAKAKAEKEAKEKAEKDKDAEKNKDVDKDKDAEKDKDTGKDKDAGNNEATPKAGDGPGNESGKDTDKQDAAPPPPSEDSVDNLADSPPPSAESTAPVADKAVPSTANEETSGIEPTSATEPSKGGE
ncbi:hypothetical protein SAMN03159358_4269 [Paenibacillus sp. NFR01]|nr:hypothetical protein SAMN03159358_4269 [Paenibacillus sp. NFR01]